MLKRPVTDTIPEHPNSVVTFYRRGGTFTLSEAFPGDRTDVTTNGSGAFSADLWPNAEGLSATHYLAVYPNNETFEFVLEPGESPITVAELRAQESWNWDENPPPSLIDNERARYANSTSLSLGASLIGFLSSSAGAVGRWLTDKLSDEVNFFDFVPSGERAAIEDGTSTYDASAPLAAFVAAVKARNVRGKMRGKKVTFATGIVLEGQNIFSPSRDGLELHYTGSDTAITLQGTGTPALLENIKLIGPGSGGSTIGILCKEGASSGTTLREFRIWGFNVGLKVNAGYLAGNYYSKFSHGHVRDCDIGVLIVTTGYVGSPEDDIEWPPDIETTRVTFANAIKCSDISSNFNRVGWKLNGTSGVILDGCSGEHNEEYGIECIGAKFITVIAGWWEYNELGHVYLDEYSRGFDIVGGPWSTGSRIMPLLTVVGPGAENRGNSFGTGNYVRTDSTLYTGDVWGQKDYNQWHEGARYKYFDVEDELHAFAAYIRSMIVNTRWENTDVLFVRRGARYQMTTVSTPAVEGATQVTVSNTDIDGNALTFLAYNPLSLSDTYIKLWIDNNLALTTHYIASLDNGNGTTTLTLAPEEPLTGGTGGQALIKTQLEDASSGLRVSTHGVIRWSDRVNPPDTTLERLSAGVLRATDTLQATHISHQGAEYHKRTPVSSNYTALVTDRYIGYTGLGASGYTVTLPSAATFGGASGQMALLTIKDESGTCSSTRRITIEAAGSDSIEGFPSYQLLIGYAHVTLGAVAGGKWVMVDRRVS